MNLRKQLSKNQPRPTAFMRYHSIVQLACWMMCHLWFIVFYTRPNIHPDWWETMIFGSIVQILGIIICAVNKEFRFAWMILLAMPVIWIAGMYTDNADLDLSDLGEVFILWMFRIIIIHVLYFLTIIPILRDVLYETE